jgi:hypothetical protein
LRFRGILPIIVSTLPRLCLQIHSIRVHHSRLMPTPDIALPIHLEQLQVKSIQGAAVPMDQLAIQSGTHPYQKSTDVPSFWASCKFCLPWSQRVLIQVLQSQWHELDFVSGILRRCRPDWFDIKLISSQGPVHAFLDHRLAQTASVHCPPQAPSPNQAAAAGLQQYPSIASPHPPRCRTRLSSAGPLKEMFLMRRIA